MSSKFVFVLAIFLLAIPLAARAEPAYDMYVASSDFVPGHPVFVNVTGPANMSISIRITDKMGDIVAGKDVVLTPDGTYSFGWSPSQEGEYNATVTYATGLSISRQFLIQVKVTPEQIGELYQALGRLEQRVREALYGLQILTYFAIFLSAVAILTNLYIFNIARKRISRAETEFEKFLREEIESVFKKFAEKQGKPKL